MNIKEMICPSCKGQRFKRIGPNTYECEYCGTVVKEEQPKQQQNPQIIQQQRQEPVNVNVNIKKDSDDIFSSIEDGLGKGIGGCLGVLVVCVFLLKACVESCTN